MRTLTGVAIAIMAALVGAPAAGQKRAPDIYFAGTSRAVADAMLQLAHVGPDDVVMDLGSGDGRIVIMAAQKYGARGIGIEIDPELVRRSREIAREGEVSGRVTFIEGDLFETDLSIATVVTMWLTPAINAELEATLRRELKPGARIVSHQFPIGRWTPEQQARVAGEDIFLWTIR